MECVGHMNALNAGEGTNTNGLISQICLILVSYSPQMRTLTSDYMCARVLQSVSIKHTIEEVRECLSAKRG